MGLGGTQTPEIGLPLGLKAGWVSGTTLPIAASHTVLEARSQKSHVFWYDTTGTNDDRKEKWQTSLSFQALFQVSHLPDWQTFWYLTVVSC